jgi:hypothetical protein
MLQHLTTAWQFSANAGWQQHIGDLWKQPDKDMGSDEIET